TEPAALRAGSPCHTTLVHRTTHIVPLHRNLDHNMNEITQVTGTGVPLFLDDIDTDRIIPARFLRCVSFDGLGEHAFEDDREQDPSHPFNNDAYQNGSILVSGRNFGCGSSREHAPQALMRWGIQAVVAESFAEIFFGNCTSLGIPAVCAKREDLATLSAAIEANPQLEVTVDIDALQIRYGDASIPVTMPEGPRGALVSGQWDFLSQLLENGDQIRETAGTLPYVSSFGGEG
ncbi:MAG: 3-isopropylmalate dehydratase small subunit, partial [Maioricimonas sp. JB049]